jgi:DNA-damage-inducible protein J
VSKTEQIQVRIDPKTKAAAEAIFAKLGINPSDAVRLFYHQVELSQGIPFELKIPNAQTVQAIRDIEEECNLVRHGSLDDFKQSLRKH